MAKRKYRKGKPITSLDELAKQEFIYLHDKITHRGWFGSWQFSLVQRYIERGLLFYAVKNDMGGYDEREEDKENA